MGFAAVCGAAIAIAATAPRPPYARALDDAERRSVYAQLAIDEARLRKQAEHDWPTDAWSQDDAFHNLEYKRAKQIAGPRNMSVQDVLLSMDEGMREHWPKPTNIHQKPTVPPCRPRPIH